MQKLKTTYLPSRCDGHDSKLANKTLVVKCQLSRHFKRSDRLCRFQMPHDLGRFFVVRLHENPKVTTNEMENNQSNINPLKSIHLC